MPLNVSGKLQYLTVVPFGEFGHSKETFRHFVIGDQFLEVMI